MNKVINPRVGKLSVECAEFKVETNINKRCKKGTPHHPRSESLGNLLADVDWLFGDDSFGWKSGGDGDNGETLRYHLDIVFELEDAKRRAKR